jgi:hypothetical protein
MFVLLLVIVLFVPENLINAISDICQFGFEVPDPSEWIWPHGCSPPFAYEIMH